MTSGEGMEWVGLDGYRAREGGVVVLCSKCGRAFPAMLLAAWGLLVVGPEALENCKIDTEGPWDGGDDGKSVIVR